MVVRVAAAPLEAEDSSSQSEKLVTIGERAELFRTPKGRLYARVFLKDHYEVLTIGERASEFRTWLARQYYLETERPPSSTALTEALEVLKAKARHDGPVREVYTRFASFNGKLYLDLCNEAWEAVEIDADGWRIVHNPPVCFQRVAGMLPLPHPIEGGSLSELLALFQIPPGSDHEKLLIGWLVGTMMPNGPYTHLCVHGEQGAAKSTFTKMARMVIDPNEALSRSTPKEERDLIIAAKNSHIVALENVSHLPPWLSDALCCLSTGAGLSLRKLYTDEEEVIFSAKRPAIINGIAEVAVRGDLIDRCIFVTLPQIPDKDRRTEDELRAVFHEARPRILGALLNAVSTALCNLPRTKLETLPRMADFALWVEAAASAFGWHSGEFLATYRSNHQTAVSIEMEASPVASTLMAYIEAHGEIREMLVKDLLRELTRLVSEERGKRPPPTWPKNAQALGSELKRLAPALRSQGLNVVQHKRTRNGQPVSVLRLTKTEGEAELNRSP